MKYPKISDNQIENRDGRDERLGLAEVMATVQNLPFIFNSELLSASDSADTSVNSYVFVTPTKLKIKKARFIVETPSVGTGNLPVVSLRQGSTEIGTSAGIALSGSAGDVEDIVLDADEVELDAGTVVVVRITNPDGTITTPITGRVQIEWTSIV